MATYIPLAQHLLPFITRFDPSYNQQQKIVSGCSLSGLLKDNDVFNNWKEKQKQQLTLLKDTEKDSNEDWRICEIKENPLAIWCSVRIKSCAMKILVGFITFDRSAQLGLPFQARLALATSPFLTELASIIVDTASIYSGSSLLSSLQTVTDALADGSEFISWVGIGISSIYLIKESDELITKAAYAAGACLAASYTKGIWDARSYALAPSMETALETQREKTEEAQRKKAEEVQTWEKATKLIDEVSKLYKEFGTDTENKIKQLHQLINEFNKLKATDLGKKYLASFELLKPIDQIANLSEENKRSTPLLTQLVELAAVWEPKETEDRDKVITSYLVDLISDLPEPSTLSQTNELLSLVCKLGKAAIENSNIKFNLYQAIDTCQSLIEKNKGKENSEKNSFSLEAFHYLANLKRLREIDQDKELLDSKIKANFLLLFEKFKPTRKINIDTFKEWLKEVYTVSQTSSFKECLEIFNTPSEIADDFQKDLYLIGEFYSLIAELAEERRGNFSKIERKQGFTFDHIDDIEGNSMLSLIVKYRRTGSMEDTPPSLQECIEGLKENYPKITGTSTELKAEKEVNEEFANLIYKLNEEDFSTNSASKSPIEYFNDFKRLFGDHKEELNAELIEIARLLLVEKLIEWIPLKISTNNSSGRGSSSSSSTPNPWISSTIEVMKDLFLGDKAFEDPTDESSTTDQLLNKIRKSSLNLITRTNNDDFNYDSLQLSDEDEIEKTNKSSELTRPQEIPSLSRKLTSKKVYYIINLITLANEVEKYCQDKVEKEPEKFLENEMSHLLEYNCLWRFIQTIPEEDLFILKERYETLDNNNQKINFLKELTPLENLKKDPAFKALIERMEKARES